LDNPDNNIIFVYRKKHFDMCEEKQTIRLMLGDSYGNRSYMECSDNDIFAGDIVNMFYSAMLGLTFQESSVLDAMLDFVADKRGAHYIDLNHVHDDSNPDDQFDEFPDYDESCDPHFGTPINKDSNPLGIKYSSSVTDDTLCPHKSFA